MPSQTEIANLAAGLIGAETRLLSIDENNKVARAIRAVWATALDAMLAQHTWNFAIKRASLAELVEKPVFGYQRQFERPSDLIRLIEVNGAYVWNTAPGQLAPYSYEGTKLLTNLAAPLLLRFVWRNDDPGMFSAGFVQALAAEIAMQIALPITESVSTFQLMEKRAAAALATGKMVDGRENPVEIADEDEWILAREAD